MATSIKKLKTQDKDQIDIIENKKFNKDKILDNLNQTHLLNIPILQPVSNEIHVLSIKKHDQESSLHIKKLTDRSQYALLPDVGGSALFGKILISSLKNQCFNLPISGFFNSIITKSIDLHLIFFYNIDLFDDAIKKSINDHGYFIKEFLSNRTLIISDGNFNYPISLTKLASFCLWYDKNLFDVCEEEILSVKEKFRLLPQLYSALKQNYKDVAFYLENGILQYTYKGLTRTIDYASLMDDMLFSGYKSSFERYLNSFELSDLDASTGFPTVTVRSPSQIKVRPNLLALEKNGFIVAAAKETRGKQTPIDGSQKIKNAFKLWMKRAERHLFRHHYKARVVFLKNKKTTFSLVGEQIVSISVFPSLVRGIFDALNLPAPKKVRLIAHSEDVLTISYEEATFRDIHRVTEEATSLFRLICADGCDPLSLFDECELPDIGSGSFRLQIVPDAFFDLMHTVTFMKSSLPVGHEHYLLGLAFECLHEWGLAVVQFEKALRLDSTDPDILQGLGCALMEIGRISEALPFLKRAFDLVPEDPEVATKWGLGSLSFGRLDDAINAFERAVKLSPATATYLKNLGDGYLLQRKPLLALDYLNKAVRCDPHFADAHASLAHLHLAVGDAKLAKKHAMIAYKENPTNTEIANLLWQLTLGDKKEQR